MYAAECVIFPAMEIMEDSSHLTHFVIFSDNGLAHYDSLDAARFFFGNSLPQMIRDVSVSVNWIAPVGHTRAHAPQPIHADDGSS